MTGTDVTEPDGAGAPLSGDADAGGAAERLAVAFRGCCGAVACPCRSARC